jgi:putative acetyltransferase
MDNQAMNPAPLSLELVDGHDLERVATLREMFREYQRWLGVDLCFQDFEAELAALPGPYAPPAGRAYLAWVGRELSGCIALRALDPRTAEMKRLYVRESARGLGLGRRLARHVIDDARSLGHQRIVLDTLPKLTTAIGMYERMGFKDIEPYTHNPIPGVRFLGLDL